MAERKPPACSKRLRLTTRRWPRYMQPSSRSGAGDRVDDIPDRSVLRQLIEALEKGAGATPLPAKRPVPEDVKVLGAARADLVREAQRVGKLRNMKVSDVVD